jgi:hypothetical protein
MSQATKVLDPGEQGRRARFGRLPEPIRLQDTVEEKAVTVPDPARDTYDPDDWLVRYSA